MKAFARFLYVLNLTAICVACGGGGGENPPPANSAPTAVINVSKTSGYTPLSIEFDGSQSSDRDGNVTNYSWDFGDGTSSLGSQAGHTYTSLGLFTATLTITDDDGASSSTSVQIKSHAQIAGYYEGFISSAVTQSPSYVVAIIGTNHVAHVYYGPRISYWGDVSVTEDRATGVLSAEVWDPASTFPDGTTFGFVDVDANISARQSLTGTYSGVGDIATFQLQYFPELAERPSSLSEVSGTWGFTDGFGYTATLMVSESGELDYSDTDGWIGRGQLVVLDPTLNAFQLQFDWTHPTWNGPTSGLAYIDDFYFPGTHRLIFAESWQAVVNDYEAGSEVWHLVRSAPVAVGGSGVGANKSGIVLSPKRGGRKHR